jgi:hypothetical protein
VAQSCSCCDHPATHRFAVSYRGQTLRGAICEEHGNVVARERLGLRNGRRNLGVTKIGRALTDPNSKPHFQLILDSEPLEKVGEGSVSPSFGSGFSTRRLRSMSRARHSGYRGRNGQSDTVHVELIRVADTDGQGHVAVDEYAIPFEIGENEGADELADHRAAVEERRAIA